MGLLNKTINVIMKLRNNVLWAGFEPASQDSPISKPFIV
nr:MAG TPA: hypothetical protein [Bacteriophage sp.]